MKTKAAVLWEYGRPWSVEEIELDDPGPHEVRVKLAASGLCHSDDHVRTGDLPVRLPMVGGHEGAGVIEEVGSAVTSVKPGDHVVLAFVPACGRCRWCATGHSNLCDLGAYLMHGEEIDGGFRIHARGQDVSTMCILGTFSPYAVVHEASVVKIDDDIPLEKAALVGCGVTTGYGSAVYLGETRPGDTVVVAGIGGIGAAALQGARLAGAKIIMAIDPVPWKREMALKLGATHVAESMEAALEPLTELTRGELADVGILTVGVAKGELIGPLLALVGKNGRAVATAVAPYYETQVSLPLSTFTFFQKQLRGGLFGGANPRADIPRLLNLYREGQLLIDEMITRTYTLEEINQGYADMLEGRNIRGVIIHEH
jgi:oxidoreductase, Rxyl_3153 family